MFDNLAQLYSVNLTKCLGSLTILITSFIFQDISMLVIPYFMHHSLRLFYTVSYIRGGKQ